MGSHATPTLIARVVANDRPTLLLDETDNLLDPKREGVGDLVSILNSGYRQGGVRPTLTPAKGGGWDVSQLPTYAAVALAGIGDHLPDSLRTRCIVIELDRAQPGEIQHTDWDEIEPQAHALRDQVTAWAEQGLTTPKPKIDGLHGREREVWLPLRSPRRRHLYPAQPCHRDTLHPTRVRLPVTRTRRTTAPQDLSLLHTTGRPMTPDFLGRPHP